ncbi:MAG: bifunctional 5,10-methylenetetrahydrofolate dehydrogenase/5,10-methenyltetrahydrofolate cyclohydrolase [Opitutales bacterium]|nr:bifunctional 5,10-methylenetetrahydrofolate dehydrogenase/5,10-methenyltetrahydrofolate cyclohydrolase [Opitutales bacterium]
MCAVHNTQLLSGQPVAQQILQSVQQEVVALPGRPPSVVFLRVGEDGASVSYVQQKSKKAAEVGIHSNVRVFPETISEASLLQEIARLNDDPSVDGILLQAPLPKPLSFTNLTNTIRPEKDVDGFCAVHCGRLWQEGDALVPCTPAGIVELLKYYRIQTAGEQVVIVNRSSIVGKPLGALLLQHSEFGNATVTFCHSHTTSLSSITQQADILVLACGKPHAFGKNFVKKGAVVIDVGITRVAANNERGYVLQGDADAEDLMGHAAALTPVPGGVGLLTVAMLMKNTLRAYHLCHNR